MTEVVEPFVVPVAWRRFVLPRRADAPPLATVKSVHVDAAAQLLIAYHGDVLTSLGHRKTEGDLSEAGRAYLAEDPAATPLGAAVVVQAISGVLGWQRLDELQAFAELWRDRHGVAFAAAATAELAALEPGEFAVGRPITRGADERDLRGYSTVLALRLAYRLRRVIVASDHEGYTGVVAALTAVRTVSMPQQAVISVMAPDETAWVDEQAARLLGRKQRFDEIKSVLLTVVGGPAGAGLGLARELRAYVLLRQPELIYTFVAHNGPAAVPALVRWFDDSHSSDLEKKLLAMLTAVGGDAAIGALVERRDRPHVVAALAEAAGRFPEPVIRLLADVDGPTAARLLKRQAAHHPELAAAVHARLDGAAAERLGAILDALRAGGVEQAGPADVPPVLVSPPWLTPVRRKPLVVKGLSCDDPVTEVWAPGEREAWARGGWTVHYHHDAADFAATLASLGSGTYWLEAYTFLKAPDALTRPVIESWRPRDVWGVGEWGREIAARYGTAALPALLHCASHQAAATLPVLLPFAAPELAQRMAVWQRMKSTRKHALAWFARHPETAARALVPVAAGPAGAARTAAEAALGLLDPALVRSVAAGHGPEAAAAVEEILGVDPLSVLPRSMPVLPDWASPALLPQIRLTGGRGALPATALESLLTMLAISRVDSAYPGLDPVLAEAEPGDLAAFGWTLFGEWRHAGHPAKQGWAMEALAHLGDDETVRRLAPIIRSWPGEGGHARAVAGLDVLAGIGTDVALMYLHGIAQKVKFRGLRDRAQEKIAGLAAELGLTADELADRLVPDLGLDAGGSLVLDYGRRSFTVGFDEQLKPYVTDAAGKRLKALPKPGAQDDPEAGTTAYQRFAGLKKDVRAIAADQVRRLERAMVDQRRWSAGDFQTWFAGHPLLRHLVRRLVWLRLDADGTPIGGVRLAEDRTLADVDDETVTLGAGERIGVAHPLELGEELAAWSEVFADYAILQPFPQLGREMPAHDPEEVRKLLGAGFTGRTAPTTALLGLESRGWRRGAPQDAGNQGWFERDVPGGLSLIVEIEPGIAVGVPDLMPDQSVRDIWVEDRAGHRWNRSGSGHRLQELAPIVAAEALRDLTEVLA
ncbi:DUF4132 domain-containing protein [Actinoplanes sp. NPDC051851]|uniref:DUF4132 domain-containing protein n=1 Tax=Actinoplanes sp. NPDC051851 TaxID=3154753 RepID=UPI003414B2E8